MGGVRVLLCIDQRVLVPISCQTQQQASSWGTLAQVPLDRGCHICPARVEGGGGLPCRDIHMHTDTSQDVVQSTGKPVIQTLKGVASYICCPLQAVVHNLVRHSQ
jgi:hypothetical protein